MNTFIRLIILVFVFCFAFTLGQGHKPLDFNGDKKLTSNDVKWAIQHLRGGK